MLLILGILMLSCGCGVHTIASRIESQAEHFATYSPEVQARLKRGQIRIGDDADAVWYVYGTPSKKFRTTTAAGTVETWVYDILGYRPQMNPTVRTVHYAGRRETGTTYVIDATPEYEWQEVLRIEITDGRVSSVQMRE